MKRSILAIFFALSLNAHFLLLKPSSDNIENQENSKIDIEVSFMHPFMQTYMSIEKPKLYVNSKENELILTKDKNSDIWKSKYIFKKPALYQFLATSKPYFEPSEEKYIYQSAKVIVSSFGIENDWDKPFGLKYEIVPLVKPFGLYSNNIFYGKVLKNGKAVANSEVEVEFYNTIGVKAPTNSHITQVVKTNANGEFYFVPNQKGWWGFSALIEDGEKEYEGKMYPVENGAILWIKVH